MLKAKLVVVGGDAKAKEVDLKLPTVIGRGRDVSLTLPHPLVSRRHTELFEKDGYLFVKDLGSLNGTYVNNRRIDSEHRLAPNQLLTLGNVTFRAVYDTFENEASTENNDIGSKAENDTKNTDLEKEETVNFDRVDKPRETGGVHKRAPQPIETGKKSTVKAAAKAPVQFKSAPSTIEEDDELSAIEEGRPTSRMETPSDIFSGDEDFMTPEKSISLSSLDSLPPVSPSVSVLGNVLDLGDQPQRSAIDSVDLDIAGQSDADVSEKSDPALGSFLKKLPR